MVDSDYTRQMSVRPPRGRLLAKLLVAMLVPAALALVLFGAAAHEVARRVLEQELGRRLATAATSVSMLVLPEQLSAIAAGDEQSNTYANLRHRVEQARERLAVRRVLLVARDLTARADSEGALPLGARVREARGGCPRDRAGGCGPGHRFAALHRPRWLALQARLRPRRHDRLRHGGGERAVPGRPGALSALAGGGRRRQSGHHRRVGGLAVPAHDRAARTPGLGRRAHRAGRSRGPGGGRNAGRDRVPGNAPRPDARRSARARRAHADDAGRDRARGTQSPGRARSSTRAFCAKAWTANPSVLARLRGSSARSATSRTW